MFIYLFFHKLQSFSFRIIQYLKIIKEQTTHQRHTRNQFPVKKTESDTNKWIANVLEEIFWTKSNAERVKLKFGVMATVEVVVE